MMITRRRMLTTAAFMAIPWLGSRSKPLPGGPERGKLGLPATFPSQDPERVQDVVGASHGRIEVVRSMLKESPALAKATIDWGFGDWETAIGAASHVGNREIAALLMEHGARPDLFTFAMLGQLEVVKAYIEASPGIQKIRGPHGLTLMHHARQGGKNSEPVVAYLEEIGDADIRPVSLPQERDEMERFVGSFTSGGEQPMQFQVSIARVGKLAIKREPYGSARNMNFIGNREFVPVGADAVRIQFNEALSECTIIDGPLNLLLSRV